MSQSLSPPVTLTEKMRLKLLEKVSPAGQELIKECEARLVKANANTVAVNWDVGNAIRVMAEDIEGSKYGKNVISIAVQYLGLGNDKPGSGETLAYRLKDFAERFKREFVVEQCKRTTTAGKCLTYGHWAQLVMLDKQEDVVKYLDKIFKQSLSTDDLELEIRGSKTATRSSGAGRKPQVPNSAFGLIQKTVRLANQFDNYIGVATNNLCDSVNELEPEKCTDVLLNKLTTMREQLAATPDHVASLIEAADASIERVTNVLSERAEAAAEAAAAAEADKATEDADAGAEQDTPAPKKTGRQPASAAASNGKHRARAKAKV